MVCPFFFFFFQAEDGIRDLTVTGVQTCALPICPWQKISRPGAHEKSFTTRRHHFDSNLSISALAIWSWSVTESVTMADIASYRLTNADHARGCAGEIGFASSLPTQPLEDVRALVCIRWVK